MNTHANKTQKSNEVVVNNMSPKQHGAETTLQLVDNRPETIAQKELQNMTINSPQSKQVNQLQALVNKHSENAIQKQELEEEELLQGKFDPIQRQELEEEELIQGKFDSIQKQGLEEEELIQGKFDPIQKQGLEEEELPVQGKFNTIQKQGLEEEELLQGKFEPIQKKENNTGLSDNLKTGIENLSGYSMDDVKVHYNSDKPASLQAHAYAQGTDIHVASGQEKHVPHEAWHVVQQKQGRVKPTMQMKGNVNVNDDVGLEKEADVMGAKALQRNSKDTEGTTIALKKTTNVKQLKGDKYYWVRPDGGQWTYVGAFKNHPTANVWWVKNKSNYPNGSFSQGNTKTKFK